MMSFPAVEPIPLVPQRTGFKNAVYKSLFPDKTALTSVAVQKNKWNVVSVLYVSFINVWCCSFRVSGTHYLSLPQWFSRR